MRSVSNRLIVATAFLLLIAGLLWFGGNLYLSGQAQRVAVVAAAVDIPRGTVVTAAMLGSAEVPRGSEQGYLLSPGLALDRVAQVDVLAGTALSPRMLAEGPPPPGRVLPAGTVLAPGYLAVAVPLDALDPPAGPALVFTAEVSLSLDISTQSFSPHVLRPEHICGTIRAAGKSSTTTEAHPTFCISII